MDKERMEQVIFNKKENLLQVIYMKCHMKKVIGYMKKMTNSIK